MTAGSRPRRPMTPAALEFQRKHPRLARLIEQLVMWPVKRRIRRDDAVRLRALEETIQSVRTQYVKSRERGFDDVATVFNAAMYVLLFDRDFSALKAFYIATDDDWNKQFVARHMAVMLYEGVQDLSKLLGKELRTIMSRNGLSDSRRVELDAVRSQLAEFRHKHADRMRDLRNVMAAHRDHNVMEQLRVVDSLQPLDVYEISAEFWQVVRDLTPVLTGIMLEISTFPMLLKQFARQHGKR